MNFTDICKELGIEFLTEGHHHCRQGWVQLDCPWCGPKSGKYHLGYSLRGSFVNCWRCGSHRLVDTLAEASGTSVSNCYRLLKGMDAPENVEQVEKRGKLVLPSGIGPLLDVHESYLLQRGFIPSEIERLWKIGGIGISARLAWRIFIPFYFRGEIVSWTTRGISNGATRYISAPAECEKLSAKSLLYGEDYARNVVVIVEGPTDVWRIGPGAVATCGISYSSNQIYRMSRYMTRFVCLDSDEAGLNRADELCDMLDVFPGNTIKIVLDAKDPGSASKKEVSRIRKLLDQ